MKMSSLYTSNQKSYDFQDFDDDDEVSDDEVFVNDKSRGILDDDNGVSKPLMAPRRKVKTNKLHTEVRRGTMCRRICIPLCYALTALGSIIGIICLVIFLIHTFAGKLTFHELRVHSMEQVVGCTNFEVVDVWTSNFPKLITETAIRLNDVNSDGIMDIIIGFGTGADGYDVPTIVCDVYFNGIKPCFGGLMALDGKTGNEIWRHYSDHEVFAVNCNEDLNSDGIHDCLGAGRAGVFQAVSGKDGNLIWNFGSQEAKNNIMNIYTPQFISDQDGDGILDVVVIHGGDPLADPGSKYRLSGRILVLSGKHGKVLQWVGVPDEKESYYSVQLHVLPDGTELILFGTGGETHPGALWAITVNNLMKGDIQNVMPIYRDAHKGVMTPPVLTDINGDGIEDIVMAMFNSTVVAFDGFNFRQIWNYTVPTSETYSTPAVGYFNDDDVPDFLVKYQVGPGFPIYYYSETTVLDGQNGQPLLEKSLRDTVGAQASALTIGVEGYGNDIFLHWTADCLGHEGEGRQFGFIRGTNIHEQSRSDFCKLRFNTDLVSHIYAFSQHVKAPGFVVYNSKDRKALEYSSAINTSAVAQDYLRTHPDVAEMYRRPSSGMNPLWDNAATQHEYAGEKNKQNGPYRLQDGYHRTTNNVAKLQHGDRGNHPSLVSEFEEDIPYPEAHSVRKHGRYKTNKHWNEKPSNGDHRIPSYYTDYDLLDDEQLLPEAASPQLGRIQSSWPKGVQGGYPGNRQSWYSAGRSRGGGGRGSPFEAHMARYPENAGQYGPSDDYSLFGMSDSYGNDGGQRYPSDNNEQDSRWNSRLGYSDAYKQRLGRLKRRSKPEKSQTQTRHQRHVGPHDMDGIQRLISTGTLAPVLDHHAADANHSIDYIFATYWFFPAKTQAILPEDRDCIQSRMAQEQERFKTDNRYYGMDHDAYEEAITKECIEKNGHQVRNRTYESQSDYDPFNIHMGQMTVYRVHLRCTCEGDVRVEKAGRKCGKILPFDQQGWASYMGSRGTSHAMPRRT